MSLTSNVWSLGRFNWISAHFGWAGTSVSSSVAWPMGAPFSFLTPVASLCEALQSLSLHMYSSTLDKGFKENLYTDFWASTPPGSSSLGHWPAYSSHLSRPELWSLPFQLSKTGILHWACLWATVWNVLPIRRPE